MCSHVMLLNQHCLRTSHDYITLTSISSPVLRYGRRARQAREFTAAPGASTLFPHQEDLPVSEDQSDSDRAEDSEELEEEISDSGEDDLTFDGVDLKQF